MKTDDIINILIVEDDHSMRETLIDILSQEGYNITGVGMLSLGKQEIREKFYHIALVDINLPDGLGLDLLYEIKKLGKKTLAIVVTGGADLESAMFALNTGAFAYLKKPVNIEKLKEYIKKASDAQRSSIESRNLLKKLRTLSLKDAQTELYNYRCFVERLTAETKRAKRYGRSLAIIMIDLDDFKSINEKYGHEYGNVVLKEFSQYLSGFVRGNDTIFRYGGDEFVILLPDLEKKSAELFAQRLLDDTGKHIFDQEGKKLKLTISAGLCSFPEDGDYVDSLSDIINLADKAMFNAKEAGGNRIYAFKKKNL